jgi:hypothetical protein
LIVGDFNVAPLECDVWSHRALVDVVSHTAIEIEALERLRGAHDWVDLGRRFIPAPERNFTWWSYRSKDHTANDRGRRLDHMWASPGLAASATGHRSNRAAAGSARRTMFLCLSSSSFERGGDARPGDRRASWRAPVSPVGPALAGARNGDRSDTRAARSRA